MLGRVVPRFWSAMPSLVAASGTATGPSPSLVMISPGPGTSGSNSAPLMTRAAFNAASSSGSTVAPAMRRTIGFHPRLTANPVGMLPLA